MKEQPDSWLALVTFCAVMALIAALGFGVLFAGASVAFAVAQSTQAADESQGAAAAQISPQDFGNKQINTVVSQSSQFKQTDETEYTSKTFAGMITDSRCGARHPMDSDKTSAQCARSCVRNGSRYILVNGEKNRSLRGDPVQLDKMAGERVEVMGMLEGDTINVKSVSSR